MSLVCSNWLQKIAFVLVVFWGTNTLFGQHATPLFYLNNAPQSVYSNPAQAPIGLLNIGLPLISSTSGQIQTNGFELFGSYSISEGLDAQKFLNGLLPNNQFQNTLKTDLLHIGFSSKKQYYHFAITERLSGSVNFPKELAYLVDAVYEEYLPSTIDIQNFIVNQNYQRVYHFGAMRAINDQLNVGITGKYHVGIAAVQSNRSGLAITPLIQDNTVQLRGRLNYDFSTSGWENTENITLNNFVRGTGNQSFSVDIGANYKLRNRFVFSGSIIDLAGNINWKKGINTYAEDGLEQRIELINADSAFNSETLRELPSRFISLVDSVVENSNPLLSSRAFETSSPTYLNLSAGYMVSPRMQVALFSHSSFTKLDNQTNLKIVIDSHVKRFLNVVLSYSVIDEYATPLNLGLGLAINGGPFQFYATTDNVFMPLYYDDLDFYNLRVGFNLTVGRDYQ